MKLVGIDYGLVRTGLAATDPEGILAYPLETLDLGRFPNRKAFLQTLADRIRQEAPDLLVIGLPLHHDGTESMTTRQVRNIAQKILHRIDVPAVFMEEFLSSEEASMDLDAMGLRGKKKKAVLDQQAAVLILESYLHTPAAAIPIEPDGQHCPTRKGVPSGDRA